MKNTDKVRLFCKCIAALCLISACSGGKWSGSNQNAKTPSPSSASSPSSPTSPNSGGGSNAVPNDANTLVDPTKLTCWQVIVSKQTSTSEGGESRSATPGVKRAMHLGSAGDYTAVDMIYTDNACSSLDYAITTKGVLTAGGIMPNTTVAGAKAVTTTQSSQFITFSSKTTLSMWQKEAAAENQTGTAQCDVTKATLGSPFDLAKCYYAQYAAPYFIPSQMTMYVDSGQQYNFFSSIQTSQQSQDGSKVFSGLLYEQY